MRGEGRQGLERGKRAFPSFCFQFLGRVCYDTRSGVKRPQFLYLPMSPGARAQTSTAFLVPPDTLAETRGEGAPVDVGSRAGKPLLIVLRVADIIEQESLHVSIWGSADGKDWGAKPLFWFPERFYRGVTPAALDLNKRPEIKSLQARWEVNRWGRGYPRPSFKMSVEIQDL